MISVRGMQYDDVEAVAADMRQADREEVMAFAGLDPLAALRASMLGAALRWTACRDAHPICVCGVTEIGKGVGRPWALCTDEIEVEPQGYLRQSRDVLGQMLAVYPRLENWTDARHKRSHAWLRWLGFRLHPAQPAGVAGLPFHFFEMGAA